MRLTIKAPQNADNIPLSPAYRFLAIALKRRLLARYHSANDLLQGREVNILVADKFLNHPVFPALSARGLKLDFTKAASAHSFIYYLKKRAEDAGFKNATMYSFRRKAATNVDRAAGRSAARMFLNHNPTSMTFEKAYEHANFDLDVAAIAYGEVQQPDTMASLDSPVLYRAELVMTPEQTHAEV